MHARLVVLAAVAILLLTGAALADDVTVELTGGEVVGKKKGEGTATVEALVSNNGADPVTGVQLRCYYSTYNAAPSDDGLADWRYHEFVFDPALNPGQQVTVSFTDENAGEYILIELVHATSQAISTPAEPQVDPADLHLTYRGNEVALKRGLVGRDGVTYINTRELINTVGGGISYDALTYQVVVTRKGREVKFKEGNRAIDVDGKRIALDSKVISINNSSYLPLIEFAPLIGLKVTVLADTIALEDE